MQNTKLKRTKLLKNRQAYVLTTDHMEPLSNQVSKTVPNESYSIKEILIRHQQGLMPDLGRQGQYYQDPNKPDFDTPDLEKLRDSDLVEKEEYANHLRNKIEEEADFIKTEVEKHKAKKHADKRKEFEAEFEEKQKRDAAASAKEKSGTTEGSDKQL